MAHIAEPHLHLAEGFSKHRSAGFCVSRSLQTLQSLNCLTMSQAIVLPRVVNVPPRKRPVFNILVVKPIVLKSRLVFWGCKTSKCSMASSCGLKMYPTQVFPKIGGLLEVLMTRIAVHFGLTLGPLFLELWCPIGPHPPVHYCQVPKTVLDNPPPKMSYGLNSFKGYIGDCIGECYRV